MEKKKISIIVLGIVLLIAIGLFFVFSRKAGDWAAVGIGSIISSLNYFVAGNVIVPEPPPFPQSNANQQPQDNNFQPPEIVKAVYLTGWSAGRKKSINYIINLAKTTEINAVVIDVKDFSGFVSYETDVPEVEEYRAESKKIKNIDGLIEKLHQEGVYVIARITVFQDPKLARARQDLAVYIEPKLSFFSFLLASLMPSLWLDNLGLAWVDPSSREVWDYNIAIAKDALSRGFDELNFDYVRFPSDGNLKAMRFPFWDGKTPRRAVIKEFFQYLRQGLPDARLSVDLFGLTTVSSNDLGVGQVIEDAFEYFDFVSPMVYPSHYASGFRGYQNPAEYPYEVVKYSMEGALKRLTIFNQRALAGSTGGKEESNTGEKDVSKRNVKLRPWLQDFNLGAVYDSEMVGAEIAAVKEAMADNFAGFMLWNPLNIYTKRALEPEE